MASRSFTPSDRLLRQARRTVETRPAGSSVGLPDAHRNLRARHRESSNDDVRHAKGPACSVRTIDRLNFRGQLSDVELTLSTTLARDTGLIVVTTAEASGRVSIEVDVSRAMPHESLSQTILSTLLHEWVHAYFRRVYCWPPKCNDLWCGHRWGRAMGPDCHGDVWQSLADAVERVANQELEMERPFQLGRREQVEEQLVRVVDDSDDSTSDRCLPEDNDTTDGELGFPSEKLGGRPNARTDHRNDLADNTATISYSTKLRWHFLNDTACGEAASSS
ncbi:hypothetical protein LTR82_001000 [Friedmanniomyces endolithicus]|uniref:Uncharacterized protein n=1 Tax=Friedmanniomyces endolithicus TaxID=329885 RepID=A0AAN6G2C0_9PEZI|nr:hypothetical protein LTR82_001000 [Friedmanniomyces endolithicus]